MRILVYLLPLFLVSCSNAKKAEVNEVNNVISDDIKNGEPVLIQLTVRGTYCGGADPGEDLLREMMGEDPLTYTKIYIRKGNENDVEKPVDYIFKSDSLGIIQTYLPKGTYSIVFEDKANKERKDHIAKTYEEKTLYNSAVDKDCLDKHFLKPEALLIVSEESENKITVKRIDKCPWASIPCVYYSGPLPP